MKNERADAFSMHLFLKYVIPSLFAFLFSAVYALVDGFFLGNEVGEYGLSAITFAYPVTALMLAAGTGIGMGGAVKYSIAKAADASGSSHAYRNYTAGTLHLLFVIGMALMIVTRAFTQPIMVLLGAEGTILTFSVEYLRVVAAGALFQVFGTGMVPLVRNCGGSTFSMISMITGFLMNVFLDYLLVWRLKWGMAGAAWATVMAQASAMVLCSIYLIIKKEMTVRIFEDNAGHVWKEIIKVAVSPFGITYSASISMLIMDKASFVYGGDAAAICYATILYFTWIALYMYSGVSEGVQPLMSRFYGEGDAISLRNVRRYAHILSMIIGVFLLILFYILRYRISYLMGVSDEMAHYFGDVIPVFLAAFPFLSVLRVETAYAYATEKNRYAYFLSYAEIVFLAVCILILPRMKGMQGVWLAPNIAQMIPAVIAVVIMMKRNKEETSRNCLLTSES